jgi:type II secretory ATPase GspE/PulE/Tfp pilus assembly ATPase PilB-like protein
LQEVLVITPAVREAVLQGLDRQRLQELAEQEGMRTLWQDGLDKVLKGDTTLAELKRVI